MLLFAEDTAMRRQRLDPCIVTVGWRAAAAPRERGRRAAGWGGFTLTELLVVIAIIAILAALSITLAARVTQGGRVRVTEDTLKVLDQILTEYLAAVESKTPKFYRDEATPARGFPLVDGTNANGQNYGDEAQPSLALFLLMAAEVGPVDSMLKGLDSTIIARLPVRTGDNMGSWPVDRANMPVEGVVLYDGFRHTPVNEDGLERQHGVRQPIRFVHPAFDGGHGRYAPEPSGGGAPVADVNRDDLWCDTNGNGAQDGDELYTRSYRNQALLRDERADEGVCVGDRPYFYSAGADGDPGTKQDNVYTVRPQFPPETADLD